MACIIVGLEYIHSQKIIHRDIKPENLVLDENGYLRITDFGIAKSFSNNNAKETSGTPGYMAPEVMKGENHSYAVDFFALGIIGYEFMLGRRPYNGRSRREIKEQMLTKHAQISINEIPNGWTEDAADFFNKLLQRKPDIRLGSKGIWELKQHRWMKYFPWDKLLRKELEAPFIPEKKDNFDKKYCEANDSINIETKVRYEKYKSDMDYENFFLNFTFYRIISENSEEKKDNKVPKEESLLSNPLVKNNPIHEINPLDSNDKENLSYTDENINSSKSNQSKKYYYNNESSNNYYNKNNNNNSNKKNEKEKMPNISIKKPMKKNISFTVNMRSNKNNNINEIKALKDISEINKEKINEITPKQSFIIRKDNTFDILSDNLNINMRNKHKNKFTKNSRSKTPIYIQKRRYILEENNSKNIDMNEYNNKSQNKSKSSNLINDRLINKKKLLMSQNKSHYSKKYDNYKENIRNLFSKKDNQKMNICTPGYYSKHSLQISCNSNRFNNLTLKRHSSYSDFNKTPTASMNSITKSPKITTSTSTSLRGYKKRSKSITPINNNKNYLRKDKSAKNIHKNFINEKNNKSRVNLSNLYNQNFSYVKRIREMNSLNYNNRLMNNISKISNIKNKNKRSNEIISSYSISSSSILKQIRNTNYNKNKINNANKNNPMFLYNNINNNQRMKQNNKISLELELNADSQTFNKYNKNNMNDKPKQRKSNSNLSIRNNILNKNNSTINISSMKMAMNGNININVVIKGNNNTTNLINKIEVNKKRENDRYKGKKMQRSHSIGFFNFKLQ